MMTSTTPTLDAIRELAAVGGLCAAISRWTRGKRIARRACRWSCSPPWQWMIGCTNQAIVASHTVGHFGRRDVRRECARCLAFRVYTSNQGRARYQEILAAVREESNVADYRTLEIPRCAAPIDGGPRASR